MNEPLLHNLNNEELLRYVDRSSPEVAELAKRLESMGDKARDDIEVRIQMVRDAVNDTINDVIDRVLLK